MNIDTCIEGLLELALKENLIHGSLFQENSFVLIHHQTPIFTFLLLAFCIFLGSLNFSSNTSLVCIWDITMLKKELKAKVKTAYYPSSALPINAALLVPWGSNNFGAKRTMNGSIVVDSFNSRKYNGRENWWSLILRQKADWSGLRFDQSSYCPILSR